MAAITASDRARAILDELESLTNPANIAGMARYGIRAAKVYGVGTPVIRRIAKQTGRDHALAAALWKSRALEARLIAGLVEEPAKVTRAQMERWAKGFDSWALCDGICLHLFGRTSHGVPLSLEWAARDEEFVKRAGFVLMAVTAVHDKSAPDELFLRFLSLVEREADDPRNFVRKAVNWALRQIGKRNMALNLAAVAACRRLAARAGSARWVGTDALRELTSEKTLEGIRRRGMKKRK
jgi:3-methyladenine DNA glycosylase AlkD